MKIQITENDINKMVMSSVKHLLREMDNWNYPMGADDDRAPWNQPDEYEPDERDVNRYLADDYHNLLTYIEDEHPEITDELWELDKKGEIDFYDVYDDIVENQPYGATFDEIEKYYTNKAKEDSLAGKFAKKCLGYLDEYLEYIIQQIRDNYEPDDDYPELYDD